MWVRGGAKTIDMETSSSQTTPSVQTPSILFVESSAFLHHFWESKVGDMMLLGWESNTSIWQKSAKLEGGNLSLGVGNPRFPTLCMKHFTFIELHCIPCHSSAKQRSSLTLRRCLESNYHWHHLAPSESRRHQRTDWLLHRRADGDCDGPVDDISCRRGSYHCACSYRLRLPMLDRCTHRGSRAFHGLLHH